MRPPSLALWRKPPPPRELPFHLCQLIWDRKWQKQVPADLNPTLLVNAATACPSDGANKTIESEPFNLTLVTVILVRFRIGTRNLLQIHSSGWKQRLDGIKSRGFGYTVEQWVPVVLQVRVYNLWNIVIRFQSRKRILFIQIDSSNISSERLRAWRSVYYSSASIHLHHNIDVWLKHLEESSNHLPLQLVLVTSIGHRTSVWDAFCMWWFFSCLFEVNCRCIQLLEHRYRRRFSRENKNIFFLSKSRASHFT